MRVELARRFTLWFGIYMRNATITLADTLRNVNSGRQCFHVWPVFSCEETTPFHVPQIFSSLDRYDHRALARAVTQNTTDVTIAERNRWKQALEYDSKAPKVLLRPRSWDNQNRVPGAFTTVSFLKLRYSIEIRSQLHIGTRDRFIANACVCTYVCMSCECACARVYVCVSVCTYND